MVESIQTDILVVGGGPAGLLAAWAAASAGVKTLLIEREDQIGHPVHTSGATALKTMRDFAIPAQYYHAIQRWRICSPQNSVVFDHPQPWAGIIDVRGMYLHLADRARNRGAVVLTGVKAVAPILSGANVLGCVAVQDGQKDLNISSKILIDASGYTADISRLTGLHSGFKRFGVGAEYELIAPECRQDEAVLIVGNHFAPCGYAWAFPWGKNRVRLGVGILHADSTANPREYLQKLLNEAGSLDINLNGHQIVENHYGLVPADGMVDKLVGPGIMAVGDAGGQASLIAGEGIRLSLQAGRMAGEAASAAIKKGQYGRRSLIQYERAFNSRYRLNLKIGYWLNTGLARWNDQKWDKGVQTLKSMPDSLLTSLLQSEFSSFEFAGWLAMKPQLWTKVIKYGWKVMINK